MRVGSKTAFLTEILTHFANKPAAFALIFEIVPKIAATAVKESTYKTFP